MIYITTTSCCWSFVVWFNYGAAGQTIVNSVYCPLINTTPVVQRQPTRLRTTNPDEINIMLYDTNTSLRTNYHESFWFVVSCAQKGIQVYFLLLLMDFICVGCLWITSLNTIICDLFAYFQTEINKNNKILCVTSILLTWATSSPIIWAASWENQRKVVSEEAGHKPSCTSTVDGWKFWI